MGFIGIIAIFAESNNQKDEIVYEKNYEGYGSHNANDSGGLFC